MKVLNTLLLAATAFATADAQMLANFTVGEAVITMSETTGILNVAHAVGGGGVEIVDSMLKEVGCVDDYASGEVMLTNENFVMGNSSMYTYDLEIDTSNLESSGEVTFCTVVTSRLDFMGTISPVSVANTNFNVEFDLTTGGFTSTVGVTANDQDEIDEELPSDFFVTICACMPGTFVCGMPEFTQDSEVNLCLITEDANGPTGDVRISNFDLTFVGVTVPTSEYEPVEFGTTMPETNPLTTLTYGMGEGGEVIQVTTRLVASLFVGIAPGGTQDIETSGNTFLEFSNSKVGDTIQFEQFQDTISVTVTDDTSEDEIEKCGLMDRIRLRLSKIFGGDN